MHWMQHSTEYCLVLSDIRMPEVTGFEIARRIRELNRDVKIVLCSAFEIDLSEFEKVMPHTHVDAFIQKPVSLNTLFRVISKLIADSKIIPSEVTGHK